ncbi:conserved hypothetical protein [Candidatus Terasakiella magnetica]|nr:conserved hypothetical protein [Candidatus Terasakiella magnetica]
MPEAMTARTQGDDRRTRAVLFHAPRWKIPVAGQHFPPEEDGPPVWVSPDVSVDIDNATISYGMLSLAAQGNRAGFLTSVFNVNTMTWNDIGALVACLDADLFGMTLNQSNFRGVGALAELIKSIHPAAKVVIGGPQATALPVESLHHLPAVDLVVVGEGEETFLEILERMEAGESLDGVAGTAWRQDGRVVQGPCRAYIDDLDSLASPHDYFTTRIFMTSRGCPMKCTFCGSGTVWGQKVRAHSAEYILEGLTRNIRGGRMPFILVKDDTFTVNRKRVRAICDGIAERGLNVMWSCDTRADCLDEDTLRRLRLAGCQRISLGVESASEAILETIKKKVTPAKILEVTRFAQKYGIRVRYYMIYGSPGESAETLQESLDFLKTAQPNESIFCCYSIYPGTEDFTMAQEKFGLNSNAFFDKTVGIILYQAGKTLEVLDDWYQQHKPEWSFRPYSAEHCRGVVDLLPDFGPAHADLAAALIVEGQPEAARVSLANARRLGYPVPGFLDNMDGVIAALGGDGEGARKMFEQARSRYPHHVAGQNLARLDAWAAAGWVSEARPNFEIDSDCEQWVEFVQPELPGPIALADLPPRRQRSAAPGLGG